MVFKMNLNLKLLDMDSSDDYLDLCDIFDDLSLSSFIDDHMFSKYIYLVKENNNVIGFIYLIQYGDSDIYNVEYGIVENKLNEDYIYTILTLIRDKIKGNKTKEIEGITILTSLPKNNSYNKIANLFGNKLYSNELYDFYCINPNCENIEMEEQKILNYFINRSKFN